MTESNRTEKPDDEKYVLSFGESLFIERKKQNLTVADVAGATHLSEQVIDAIERSDVEQLPQPAFVQGYLRAYAKYLGASESQVLEDYARDVPHQQESYLQPRSMLPDEASSDTFFIKMITVMLLLVTVVAAIYASFSYYKNALQNDEAELENHASLSLPEVVSDDQAGVEHEFSSESETQIEVDQAEAEEVVVKKDVEVVEATAGIVEDEQKQATEEPVVEQRVVNQLSVEGDDVLGLTAVEVSWAEVDDANGENLYYDMLQPGQSISLQGTAPF
ncbi:MAG: DUF4115 domain-containing protein, partial [Gammaproteobacteria bacterium]|nr:DUF4115 domain-containing protein [Gammaproteobacteria bacterium]